MPIPDAKWWDTLPSDVQSLLNLAQVYVDCTDHLAKTLESDLVRLRRTENINVNFVVDSVVKAQSDLVAAVRDYQRAGGNHRAAVE